jgi:hypothetical protein
MHHQEKTGELVSLLLLILSLSLLSQTSCISCCYSFCLLSSPPGIEVHGDKGTKVQLNRRLGAGICAVQSADRKDKNPRTFSSYKLGII